ncbi:MAG: hypothetical protein OEL55_04770, partial [Desulfobulbaceae bacterium]|nr:hypothetical protein [Desulfobulbaceae bacterium]
MERIEKISQAIPANKFQPPHLAEGQMLQRYEIIQESNIQSVRPRIIYLESQAGQGKTTLALQWLQGNTIPYCWYQVGLEDHDPVLFISAMLVMLSKALPSFDSPDLINQLENGEISLLDLPGCVNLLLQDFATCVNQEIIIVIDDLHLLENAEITISVLDQILNTAPESIRFLLASRRPVPLRTISLPRLPGVLCLNNDHLALSRFQAFELIHDVMQVSVSWPMLEEIHKHTAGWFMGVIIAGHALASGKEQTKFSDSATADEYFRREILAQLPQDMHMPLARLSFLGEIEIPLAEQVTGVDNIGDYLRELMAKNYFVRSLDADNQVFGFHHFFQDFLQQLGREQLEEKAIVDVFSQAAIYSLQQGRLEQALSYYAKGGLYYEIEALLRRDGMQLLARNRNITLCGILATIPEKVIADSSWLSLYLGLARLDLDPEATFPL